MTRKPIVVVEDVIFPVPKGPIVVYEDAITMFPKKAGPPEEATTVVRKHPVRVQRRRTPAEKAAAMHAAAVGVEAVLGMKAKKESQRVKALRARKDALPMRDRIEEAETLADLKDILHRLANGERE